MGKSKKELREEIDSLIYTFQHIAERMKSYDSLNSQTIDRFNKMTAEEKGLVRLQNDKRATFHNCAAEIREMTISAVGLEKIKEPDLYWDTSGAHLTDNGCPDGREIPCYYKRFDRMYPCPIRQLHINDEEAAHKMIFDILKKTECSIKKDDDGKLVIFKKKPKIDKEYDVYVKEDESHETTIEHI